MSEQKLGPGGIDTRTPDMAQGRAEVAGEHDMTAKTCLSPVVGGRAGRLPAATGKRRLPGRSGLIAAVPIRRLRP